MILDFFYSLFEPDFRRTFLVDLIRLFYYFFDILAAPCERHRGCPICTSLVLGVRPDRLPRPHTPSSFWLFHPRPSARREREFPQRSAGTRTSASSRDDHQAREDPPSMSAERRSPGRPAGTIEPLLFVKPSIQLSYSIRNHFKV